MLGYNLKSGSQAELRSSLHYNMQNSLSPSIIDERSLIVALLYKVGYYNLIFIGLF